MTQLVLTPCPSPTFPTRPSRPASPRSTSPTAIPGKTTGNGSLTSRTERLSRTCRPRTVMPTPSWPLRSRCRRHCSAGSAPGPRRRTSPPPCSTKAGGTGRGLWRASSTRSTAGGRTRAGRSRLLRCSGRPGPLSRAPASPGTAPRPRKVDSPPMVGPAQHPGEVVLDENELADGSDYFSLGVFDIRPDQEVLAYAIDRDGSERYTLRFRDLGSGDDLADVVEDVQYGSAWSGSCKTFYYVRPDKAMRPWQVWRHSVGTPASKDQLRFPGRRRAFFRLGRPHQEQTLHPGDERVQDVERGPLPACRQGTFRSFGRPSQAGGGRVRRRPRRSPSAGRRLASALQTTGRTTKSSRTSPFSPFAVGQSDPGALRASPALPALGQS